MSTDREINDAEAAVMHAIAADIKISYGDDVQILSYVVVAEVLTEDGVTDTRYTVPNGTQYHRSLGLLEWLKIRLQQAMTR